MNRQNINRISGIVPVILSALAFALVLVAVTTGWERHLKDEGAAAHIFQLLIVAQLPFVVAYLATADWRRLRPIARPIAFQVVILAVTFATARFFRL